MVVFFPIRFDAQNCVFCFVLHGEDGMVGCALADPSSLDPSSSPVRGGMALALCQIVISRGLAITTRHQGELKMIVGDIAQCCPRQRQTVGFQKLDSCRGIKKYAGDDAPLGIDVSGEDVVIELIMVGFVFQCTVANLVLKACRQFQHV